MDFEELQKSWRSQPVNGKENITVVQGRLMDHWRKHQRKVLWGNIGTTAGFSAAFCVFIWIYISFHKGRTIFFSGSLLATALLMLVYLWVIWKGIILKKTDASIPSAKYLDNYLEKIYWRKKLITTYSWIYTVLLWLCLMCYFVDITYGGSLLFRVGAPVATTAYIFGMQLVTRYTSGKKQLKKLDALIEDIQKLKADIDQE